MKTTYIPTQIGRIAVYIKSARSDKPPLILLHGVYFDHHLWDYQEQAIHDRTVITIDMPHHGASKAISNANWNLDDCARMLIEIMDHLHLTAVFAVGHSWGSMTVLRAAAMHSSRFAGLLLCNMPFQATTRKQRFVFRIQHTLLPFRSFYTHQAAKALFGESSLRKHPDLIDHMKRSMSQLTNHEIKLIDRSVILQATDTTDLIANLKIPAVALKGEEDYLSAPPGIKTIVIQGGHISPLEQPEKVLTSIQQMIQGSM